MNQFFQYISKYSRIYNFQHKGILIANYDYIEVVYVSDEVQYGSNIRPHPFDFELRSFDLVRAIIGSRSFHIEPKIVEFLKRICKMSNVDIVPSSDRHPFDIMDSLNQKKIQKKKL